MGELKISPRVVSGVSVSGAEGRLDLHGAAVLEAYAEPRLNAGELRLVQDLTGVDYISSAGLRSLLVVAKKAQAVKGCLVLCGWVTLPIKRVFRMAGMSDLFDRE